MTDTTYLLVLSLLVNVWLGAQWFRAARQLWDLEDLRRRFVIFLSASRN